MNASSSLVDLTPVVRLALTAFTLALIPLGWWWLRHRSVGPAARLRALTLLTLFLTFDLVMFGAFTRLTDSGLGCPDWPGCYGNASPVGAHSEIHAAQTAMPSGPVTRGKAWVEMVHRYLAMGVGLLITVLAIGSWVVHWRGMRQGEARGGPAPVSPWWATATFAWVCLQGAFGAWTVTMKLYPAIVTGHLLGGIGLMVLLAAQSQGYVRAPLVMSRALAGAVAAVALLSIAQVTLGGWVSTNYAVLACSDFPTCQGSWWPPMDFEAGFTVLRPLGLGPHGEPIPFAALTAIHVVHRLGALVVVVAVAALAWRLFASGDRALRRWAAMIAGVALWQVATGTSNVVLGWPLVAAVAHTGGAAVLITLLTVLLARAQQGRRVLREPPLASQGLAATVPQGRS
ncbi:MAG TPA: COX15/CtaA family protein [Albitalea sp.]|nr:COX15/CtaA family protein [Albitalea sp.]